MKHGKLIGLQTSAERLARVAVAAYDAAMAPQTAPSGSISLDNADGTRTIIGPQAGSGEGAPSGQAIATHVGDTTPPPVPAGIKAWSGDGSLHVMWDGTLSGDIPADFGHISILVDGEEVAQLSSAGSVTVGGVEAGSTVSVTATAEDDACLADGTPAHNVSTPCAAIVVEIRDVAEEVKEKADAHEGQIEAIQSDIEAYKQSATATYATKTEVDEKTGAITKTLSADYTKTADLGSTAAVKDAKKAGTDAQGSLSAYKASNDKAVADAKKAGTDAQSQLAGYRTSVEETYAEKTELQEAVNQLRSTMTSNYSAFTTYRTSNDTAVSKAQSDATNAQSTIDSYKSSNDKAVADAKAAGTTAQDQLSAYKGTNDQAVADAKAAGTSAQSNLDSYKTATDQRLDELKNIADNAIESWYLKGVPTTSNAPAKDWTTDALKKQHAGDLYMDTDTGYSYRWSGTEWVQVKDSDVTKALTEIANIKTDYATKTELEQTNTSLSAKVEDSLSTAKTYASGLVSTEVTQRDAAITAKANEITQQVSKTYTKSETFSAYQSDADSRIATANSNASTAKSTAQTAASDAATAKTNASSAVSTANAAKSTAQTASTNASNAVSTANSANSKSDSAVSTANSAKSTAASASSTANAAKSTVDGMQIGGRNLVLFSDFSGFDPHGVFTVDGDVATATSSAVGNTNNWQCSLTRTSTDYITTVRNKRFTFSMDYLVTEAITYGTKKPFIGAQLWVEYTPDGSTTNKYKYFSWYGDDLFPTAVTSGWVRTSITHTFPDATIVASGFSLYFRDCKGTAKFRHPKLELGNKPTDWTPAPEDTDSAVADAKKAGTDAQTSANSAKTAAANAQKAADKAQSSADDTAAALAKAAVRIRIDGTPMADGTSQLMAHVYVGNDEVSANAIAKLGTLVWKMDGVSDRRGTTTYTAKTGKFVTCRLEA